MENHFGTLKQKLFLIEIITIRGKNLSKVFKIHIVISLAIVQEGGLKATPSFESQNREINSVCPVGLLLVIFLN